MLEKINKKPIDDKKSTTWGVLPLVSGGLGGAWHLFDLLNVETKRAHQLHIGAVGAAVGFAGGSATPGYTCFRTRRPVCFDDFKGKDAYVLSLSLAAYSFTNLEISDTGPRFITPPLVDVWANGWGPGVGGGIVRGRTMIVYSGGAVGKPPLTFIPSPDHFKKIRKFVPYVIIPGAKPRVVLQDVLFDFNKASLNPGSTTVLSAVAALLNKRKKNEVRIEGHTDSKGDDAYNLRLSKQRADAVKAWLVSQNVRDARSFITAGFGERNPIAPNAKSDGRDDPEGRQKNRRVEIIADLP